MGFFSRLFGRPSKPPRVLHEKADGFSYDPPATWNVAEFPGLKNRVSYGPSQGGFAPNINVVVEAFSGSLAEYVDASFQTAENTLEEFNILEHEDLQTEDGQPGVRVIAVKMQQGALLRQTFYFFGEGGQKYVATCTARAEGGEALDVVFAKSMKTFRIH